jgi:hypothetical protein
VIKLSLPQLELFLIALLRFAAFHVRKVANMSLSAVTVRKAHVKISNGHDQRLGADLVELTPPRGLDAGVPSIKVHSQRKHIIPRESVAQVSEPLSASHLRIFGRGGVVALFFACRPKFHFPVPLRDIWTHQQVLNFQSGSIKVDLPKNKKKKMIFRIQQKIRPKFLKNGPPLRSVNCAHLS